MKSNPAPWILKTEALSWSPIARLAGPDSDGRQMPAWHQMLPGRSGVTMVNIGVGPSNAKTITDQLVVLRPDLTISIAGSHSGQDRSWPGSRRVSRAGTASAGAGSRPARSATAYMRDDRVLDDLLPLSVVNLDARDDHHDLRFAPDGSPARARQ
jgi:hypothetical protein